MEWASRTEQGDPLLSHPGRQGLPIMEMSREKKRCPGLQYPELALVLRAQADQRIRLTGESIEKILRKTSAPSKSELPTGPGNVPTHEGKIGSYYSGLPTQEMNQ